MKPWWLCGVVTSGVDGARLRAAWAAPSRSRSLLAFDRASNLDFWFSSGSFSIFLGDSEGTQGRTQGWRKKRKVEI